jgi:hypothetical protein
VPPDAETHSTITTVLMPLAFGELPLYTKATRVTPSGAGTAPKALMPVHDNASVMPTPTSTIDCAGALPVCNRAPHHRGVTSAACKVSALPRNGVTWVSVPSRARTLLGRPSARYDERSGRVPVPRALLIATVVVVVEVLGSIGIDATLGGSA